MISLYETYANLQTSGIQIPETPGKLIGIRRLEKLRHQRVRGRLSSTGAKLADIQGNVGPKETSVDLRKRKIDTRAIKSVPRE